MQVERDISRLTPILASPYHGRMVMVLGVGLLVAGLVYLENTALLLMIQNLSSEEPGQASGFVGVIQSWNLSESGESWIVFLGMFVLVGLLKIVGSTVGRIIQARMNTVSKTDLEAAIFANLLKQDDRFFQNISMGEIGNRMVFDVRRVCERRDHFIDVVFQVLLLVSTFVFFVSVDVIVAFATLGMMLFCAVVSIYLAKPLARIDQGYSTLEDGGKEIVIDNLGLRGIARWWIFPATSSAALTVTS